MKFGLMRSCCQNIVSVRLKPVVYVYAQTQQIYGTSKPYTFSCESLESASFIVFNIERSSGRASEASLDPKLHVISFLVVGRCHPGKVHASTSVRFG